MIGWFSINFRYSQCSMFGGRVSQYRVCFFVVEVLPDHSGQNTVKGRLTRHPRRSGAKLCVASLEDRSQSEDGSGSHCFDKPDWRISTTYRDGTTHGALGLISTPRRIWLPHPWSLYRTAPDGTRFTCRPCHRSCRALVLCCLLLNDRGHTLGVQLG